MEGSHVISTIYLANAGLEILSLRRSSCQREFFFVTFVLRVCLSIIDIIFGVYFVHVQGVYICIYVKKKKTRVYYFLSLSVYIDV